MVSPDLYKTCDHNELQNVDETLSTNTTVEELGTVAGTSIELQVKVSSLEKKPVTPESTKHTVTDKNKSTAIVVQVKQGLENYCNNQF